MKFVRDRDLALVGIASLLLALGVAFVPSVAALLRPFAELTGPTTVLLIGAVTGLLGLWSFTHAVDSDETALWTPDKLPERAYYDEHRTAGADVDAVLADEEVSEGPRRDARNRIRETAISVLCNVENCGSDEAIRMLEDGTWTDDPRAAAFFATAESSAVPLRTRMRDWASGEVFEKQACRTVAELERLADDGIESHRRSQHSGLFADDERNGSAKDGRDSVEAADDSAETTTESNAPDTSSERESFEPSTESSSNGPPLAPEMRATQATNGSRKTAEDGGNDETPVEADPETEPPLLADEKEGTR